jgi:hypothetical protein
MTDMLHANRMPATLVEAHEVVRRQRPKLADEPRAWVAFHRRSAEIYSAVAEVDGRRRHEARYYAGREIRQARAVENSVAD